MYVAASWDEQVVGDFRPSRLLVCAAGNDLPALVFPIRRAPRNNRRRAPRSPVHSASEAVDEENGASTQSSDSSSSSTGISAGGSEAEEWILSDNEGGEDDAVAPGELGVGIKASVKGDLPWFPNLLECLPKLSGSTVTFEF